jgi:ketosteroid isomerase-like protein
MLVALVAPVVSAQTTDVQAILDIEQRLAQAWVDRDRKAIDAVLADEWSVTDASGRILTKPEVMQESFGSTERRIDRMVVDDVKVRVYGETAVATGRTQATGSYRGTSASVVLRFTDVFVRRDGRWQAVASHASTVAP